MDHATQAVIPARDTAPFWQSTAGKLLVQCCDDCAKTFYYPRTVCPFCLSDNVTWVESTGRGKIYSFSVLRRADPPYAIAFVTLDEGVRMMTNIVGCDMDAIRIDQPVEVVFEDRDGVPTPMFTPVGGA